MKYFNILVLTMCIFSNTIFSKESTSPKKKVSHNSYKPKTKTVVISLSSKPSIDMQVNFSSSYRLDNVIITPDTDFVSIDIEDTIGHNVNFTVFPAALEKYLKTPKEKRKNYNYNSDFDGLNPQRPLHSGEQRLLGALSASVSYEYDKLPSHIRLPNPMDILKELLHCEC